MTSGNIDLKPLDAPISIVVQGGVGAKDTDRLRTTIAQLRRLRPSAQVILSTWIGAEKFCDVGADILELSTDPGVLHSIRPDGQLDNNINRQIRSTHAGLARASHPFAIKMRTDASLQHLGFLRLFNLYSPSGDRIIAPSFFTIDPTMFEHVPFHISDWFQFGATANLRTYWNCRYMNQEEATWYGTHLYAAGSSDLDKRFYCKLAVEQHIASQYASALGYEVPEFHNDNRKKVIESYYHFLANHWVIASPEQIGLDFPKYDRLISTSFQRLNCVSFEDWLWWAASHSSIRIVQSEMRAVRKRRRQKSVVRALYRASRPLQPVLSHPIMRPLLSWMVDRLA